MPWHVQHHFPVDKCAICITVWADRKVSSAEKKLLPKVPLREASTKSPEQSEAFSHFCRAFDRHFHIFFFFFPMLFFPNRFSLEGSPVKPRPEDDRCHCEWPHSCQDLPVQGVCSQPGGEGPLQHWDQQVMTVRVCVLKGQTPGQGKNATCGQRNEIIFCAKTGRWRSWDFPGLWRVLCGWQELGMVAFGGCRRSAHRGREVSSYPRVSVEQNLGNYVLFLCWAPAVSPGRSTALTLSWQCHFWNLPRCDREGWLHHTQFQMHPPSPVNQSLLRAWIAEQLNSKQLFQNVGVWYEKYWKSWKKQFGRSHRHWTWALTHSGL